MNNRIPRPLAIIERNIGQWYLQWADGTTSEDFYNKARAGDIMKNYMLYRKITLQRDRKASSSGLGAS